VSSAEAEAAFAALEQRIGRAFKDKGLLREALTHASAFDARQHAQRNYERLEFLGDRVLGLVVAEKMYASFPKAGESGLAPRLNALVNRSACARAARRAELGAALVLSRSEEEQGGT
jgi:ribonuclease-3